MMELEEFRVDVCVRGYHIYKDIWYAVVGKVIIFDREPNNSHDRYAIAVRKKNSTCLSFAHKATMKIL